MDETQKVAFCSMIEKSDRIFLFLHDFPDPDCLGAAVGLEKLIKDKWDKPCLIFGTGLSHPQNKTIVNMLNIELKDPFDYFSKIKSEDPSTENTVYILVDMNPNSRNFKFNADSHIDPDWVIDHHIDKDREKLEGEHINIEEVGSTCTIIEEYMGALEIKWNDEDEKDTKIATAMMLGIMTDTSNLQNSTARDLCSFEGLKEHYDQDLYNSIDNYELNSYFYDVLDTAYKNRQQTGSLLVLNLGYLAESRRDTIPFVADLWKKNKDVSVVIAFAIIANTITASVRVKGLSTIKANDLARGVFKSGDSGGHPHMAGATVPLNEFFDLSLLDDEKKAEFLHTTMAMIVERAKKLADLDE